MPDAPDFEACVVERRLKLGPVYDLYLARHTLLGRAVVIKALEGQVAATSPAAQRLEHEARLLARVSHDNIARVLDFVRQPERVWSVLEHEPGFALADLLLERPALERRAAAAVALGVARALDELHDSGIVHNALSPANVWLTERGRVRLQNLEHATSLRDPALAEPLDGAGESTDTAYLTPEQITGEPTTPASDVFALGVLLYRLLSGRLPFAGNDPAAVRAAIRHELPTPLESVVPEVPPELARIVQRCLEKDPEQRFASASEVARALEHFLERPAQRELERAVRGAIARAGLGGEPDEVGLSLDTRAARAPLERALRRALGALVVTSLVMLAGGLALHKNARIDDAQARRDDLPPSAYGALRVVAEPWAHVYVDGKLMETTPFAEPLRLTPGRHYVRLEHPQTKPVRREVELVAGETLLLDVSLSLGSGTPDAGAPRDAGARR